MQRVHPSILILKPGSLGDALLFTGALHALRLRFPRHRLVLICSSRGRPAFERSPDVDVLLAFDEGATGDAGWYARIARIRFAARILGRHYDQALLASTTFGAEPNWAEALFENVIATRKLALREGVSADSVLEENPDQTVAVSRDAHELDKTLELLRAAGCGVLSRREIWPDVGISAQEREWALGKAESRKQKAEIGTGDGGKAESRKQKAENKIIDCRLQTEDFLTTEDTEDAERERLDTTSNIEHRTSNIQQSDNQEPRTKNQEPDSQGLRSAVCGLQSEPKSLRSAVCGLQSGQLTLALCPGARFKQKQWGTEKYSQLLCELSVLAVNDLPPATLKTRRALRVLILGGAEDREVAGEILRKVESRKQKAEMGGESLAEARRTLRTEGGGRRTEEGETLDVRRQATDLVEKSEIGNQKSEIRIEDWTGRCTLHESFALIERSDLCVGNDTLGLHVAVAVGTPSVVIMWGGDGDQWIPWGDTGTHRMVRADVDCGGCGGDCVHAVHECMERISVEMVMGAVGKVEIGKAES